MKKSWLNGKRIILTGASSGIGKALCVSLVQKHGCKVTGVARNEARCKELKTLLGENFTYELFDVADETAWQNFAIRLKKSDTMPDVLINNAGMLPPFCRFEKTNAEFFDRAINTNFYAAVYACRALLPLLKRSPSPAIINVSSSAALCALPGITAYAASKAAVKSFTESLASEYKKKNLYVGLVLPGFAMTDIFREQKSAKNAADAARTKKAIAAVAMPCEKMAKKIERAIVKRKRRKIFGADAKGMNLLYKLFPSHAADICGNILKLCSLTLFESVFE